LVEINSLIQPRFQQETTNRGSFNMKKSKRDTKVSLLVTPSDLFSEQSREAADALFKAAGADLAAAYEDSTSSSHCKPSPSH
jgi:hypothetical protein